MHDVIDSIVARGLQGNRLDDLLGDACRGLCTRGIPVWRGYAATPLLDPTAHNRDVVWWRDAPSVAAVAAGTDDGAFRRGPFVPMLAERAVARSWDLTSDRQASRFAELRELRQLGGTQYVARLVRFEAAERRVDLQGLAVSFATDRAGGFTSDDIKAIDAVVPALALAALRIALLDLATGVVDAYVGRGAGRRVLDGDIRRGSGEIVQAVVLFADLRGFTAIAEEIRGLPLLDLLSAYFEVMADPVAERGGEVLKFLGDSMLAIFPVGAAGTESTCATAVAAACDVLDRAKALSAARKAAGKPACDLDVALHLGDVIYGNVGAAGRLDFAAVGPAVNAVYRIEELCDLLERNLITTPRVAELCGRPMDFVGIFWLHGLPGESHLFSLPEPQADGTSAPAGEPGQSA